LANKIAQFRYYNEKDGRNYPSIISEVNLASGSVFNLYTPIV